ncbi:hypothetical protein LZ31DRAFT_549710 [Colletotrichum somersetense]|nr:hypothetical protein LZ31DRAFT_549710 [Colletotrichum somersetense]
MDEKHAAGDNALSSPALPQPPKNEHHDTRNIDPTMFGRHSLQITQPRRLAVGQQPRPPGRAPHVLNAGEDQPRDEKSQSVPDNLDVVQRPTTAPHQNPTSSSTKRISRPSHDFDRRYDGPFGRPSLAMARSSLSPGTADEAIPRTTDPSGIGSDRSRPVFQPTPPPLNYTLRTRKRAIAIFWALIIFDSVLTPIALYFGLWYGVGPGTNTPTEKRQKLSPNAVFSIVTAALGGASIVEYFVRFWRLWRKGSTCRVIGAHRWYLDWFHWNLSFAWIVVMIELIVGTVPEHPPIRLLSMPVTTMLFVFGTELLLVDVSRAFHIPAPCRISSIPKGAQLRPGIYSLIEDVCAVDGSGGTEFRIALDRRYEASHIFRAMLRRLGIFWAVGAEACAALCTALIFTMSGDVAYTIGWSLPFVWAGLWTLATFCYVSRELKREARAWAEEAAKKGAASSMASV